MIKYNPEYCLIWLHLGSFFVFEDEVVEVDIADLMAAADSKWELSKVVTLSLSKQIVCLRMLKEIQEWNISLENHSTYPG